MFEITRNNYYYKLNYLVSVCLVLVIAYVGVRLQSIKVSIKTPTMPAKGCNTKSIVT